MVALKKLDEIALPDRRQRYFIKVDMQASSVAAIALADLHRTISSIEIYESAPADIHHQYDLARNLFLYSWFVYEFSTVAVVQLSLTLELALKLTFSDTKIELPKRTGLRNLLNEAVSLGWLDDDPKLFNAIAGFRNSLAHGELTIQPASAVLPFFQEVSQIINKLQPH